MDSYVKNQLKRKVSSFILSEAGKVGNRNTFSAATLVTASSLAAVLLTTKTVLGEEPEPNCGDEFCDPDDWTYCCVDYINPWNMVWYGCADSWEVGQGGVDSCWPL